MFRLLSLKQIRALKLIISFVGFWHFNPAPAYADTFWINCTDGEGYVIQFQLNNESQAISLPEGSPFLLDGGSITTNLWSENFIGFMFEGITSASGTEMNVGLIERRTGRLAITSIAFDPNSEIYFESFELRCTRSI